MAFHSHSFSFRTFFRPMALWRLLFLGILGVTLAIASADWAISTVRLTDLVIESHLDSPKCWRMEKVARRLPCTSRIRDDRVHGILYSCGTTVAAGW